MNDLIQFFWQQDELYKHISSKSLKDQIFDLAHYSQSLQNSPSNRNHIKQAIQPNTQIPKKLYKTIANKPTKLNYPH